jgi:hypothetical protein
VSILTDPFFPIVAKHFRLYAVACYKPVEK